MRCFLYLFDSFGVFCCASDLIFFERCGSTCIAISEVAELDEQFTFLPATLLGPVDKPGAAGTANDGGTVIQWFEAVFDIRMM